MGWFLSVLAKVVRKCLMAFARLCAAFRCEPRICHTAEWWSRYYQRTVGTFILMIWLIMAASVIFQKLAVGIRTWSNASPSCSYAFTVEINTVSWPELTCLPGIGEVLARRIVSTREEIGGFTSCEDLKVVRGIGPKTVEKVKPFLTFGNSSRADHEETAHRESSCD